MLTTLRRRASSYLHLCAARLYDDFHVITLTAPDGSRAEFACYYQWTGSWPEGWRFECDCTD